MSIDDQLFQLTRGYGTEVARRYGSEDGDFKLLDDRVAEREHRRQKESRSDEDAILFADG